MTERASLLQRCYQGLANIPIRVLLTVPFMLQLVGAVGIVGYLSDRSGQQSVRELADQLTQQVSLRIHDRLTIYLHTPQDVVAANHLAVQQGTLDLKNFEQLQQLFWQQVTLNPLIEGILFSNEEAEVIAYGRFQSEETVKESEKVTGENLSVGIPFFYSLKSNDLGKRKYYLVDPKGNPRKLIYTFKIDNRTTPWYRYGKATRQQTWSPISVYKILPTLGIYALAPIYDATGKWRGVFASDFTLAGFNTFLNQLKFSPSGQTFIMERSGNLVATSTLEIPFVKPALGEPTRLLAVNSKDTRTRDIARQLTHKFGNLSTLQTTQQLTLMSNHEPHFVRVTPYQDRYGLDWLVVVIIPESDFMADIRANTQRTWLLCGLTLVVAAGTGMLSARWIARPIYRLQQAADAIATGQLDYSVETCGVGEVAHLTIAFQRMAHQLETSFRSLQESEQRFEHLLHNVPVGISVFDSTGNQILLNQVGETILGQGNISNLPFEQLCQAYQIYQAGTDQLYPVEQLPVTQALLGETTFVDDLEIEVKGERVALEVHAIPFFDAAGNLLYAILAFQDITKRRQAERILTDYSRELEHQVAERTQELQRSEERFRSAFEDAPIGMALVALQGQFIRVNRSLCHILGYSQEELLTKTFPEITHPDDVATNLEQVQRVIAGEINIYQVQKRYLHQQGHIVWALVNVSVVRDSRKDPIYFIAQIQDISDRYAIEQMKNEFISIVSHELRTPLTAIHGSLGILESGIYHNNSEKFNHLISIALNNSDRLVRLVNDILDLERLESQKTELVKEACEVTDLIEQAVETVQPLADTAKIHLDWTPLSVSVWAAPDAIVQTLTNLLSNAIKFSPAGSTVSVKAEVIEAKDSNREKVRENTHTPLPYILFSTRDRGRGIPADKLETIFGRFQQVDVQDSRQKGGTGLGLAICKSIVQQHQGQIWVESVWGTGSTFYFTLPVQPQAE
ncbi:putative diguanylate cyclase DgcE (plasmid) [Planktothrix tepida]|uniref:histidine kinase n=1 Tax=Planktothrix tepida PCC 9214 TaxID=671072 RepID=A0A1J1LCR8_9CYAN|nr:HAMP domain-containing histidine kinase [Planktothrix tepida]CAD5989116.1 putative diguanylate cyclase DgcE [Planktothrix tepida]CUR30256.1 putative Multi-sensor Signal Transduction Histidine Kinase [Planktothrix tepida PCC 9214]